MKPLIHVLLDCDGTLVNTEPACAKIARELCAWRNIELTVEESMSLVGITVEKFYRDVLAPRERSDELREFLGEHAVAYKEVLEHKLEIFPGACELVQKLHAEKRRLALVSGSTRDDIRRILKKADLTHFFDVVVTANDIPGRSKPQPDGFLMATRRMGVDPTQCVGVEDSIAGIEALVAAKTLAVQVRNSGEPVYKDAVNSAPSIAHLIDVPVEEWTTHVWPR